MSANREGRNPTSSSKWWHTLNGVDPITLEPLSSLPHPPFVLEAKAKTTGTNDTTSSRGQAKSKFYFDGEALAEYLTTSANFCNPMNRDPLSKADCQRLDEYLVANSLKQFNVHQLFAVSKNVAQGRGAQPVGHARQVALIVNNMFGSTAPSSHRSQQSGQRRPQQRTQASRDSETRHDGTTPDWPSLALSASTASTRSGNTTSAENPQYAYNRHEMGSGGGLRVIDDSEWVEEAIVPKNESSAAPVQWPKPVVEQRAPQVASGKHNDTALSWRSKRASNDKPTSSTFARRERPRLKLLPRTKPVETSLPSGSAARVSRSHGHHQTAPRPSDLRVSGFPVSMLLVTAQGKRQWVAAVEKVHFTSLVEAGMQNKSASWSPPKSTSSSSLRLLVCLAEHWGIAYNSETTADGQVVVTFTAARDAFPPSVFLSDVVLQPFVQQLLQPSPDASANKRTAESDTEEPLFWSMQAEDPEPDIKSGKVTQNLSLPNPSTMRASVLLTDIVLPAGDSANRLTDEYIERCVATSISNDRGRSKRVAAQSTSQLFSRITWISHNALVLEGTSRLQARKLFRSLCKLSRPSSSVPGKIVLSTGLRCHVQWCSASASDLMQQDVAIQDTIRGGRETAEQQELKETEKQRRRDARKAAKDAEKIQARQALREQQRTAWEVLAESSSDDESGER